MAEEKHTPGVAEQFGQNVGRNLDAGSEVLGEATKSVVDQNLNAAKFVGSGVAGLGSKVIGGIKDDFEDIKEAKGPIGKVQAGMSAASNFFLPTAMMKAGSHITGLDKVEDKLRDGVDNTVIKAVGGEVPSKDGPEKSDEGFAHRPAPKAGEDFGSLAQEVLTKSMHDEKLQDVGKGVNDAVKNSGKDDMEPIRPEKDSSKEMDKSKESSAMKFDGPEIG